MRLKVGVVDAGTNSFLLLMAEKNDSRINYFFDTSKIVGLGHLENGMVKKDAFERALEVVEAYKNLCGINGIERTVIIGTEIFRKIDNSYFELLSKGFDDFHIITGSEEALFSYRSVIEDENFVDLKAPLVVDIGGGSFECAKYFGDQFKSESVPMGALFVTDQFVKKYPVRDQLENAKEEIQKYLIFLDNEVVSIGGTGTTIASIIKGRPFDPHLIHKTFLRVEELRTLFDRMKQMNLDEISKLNGMEKGREKIITTGLFLLLMITENANAKGLYVSVRGHRYSIAKDMLDGVKWSS